MSAALFWFRDVTHAMVRAQHATDMTELNAGIAPVALSISAIDGGAQAGQSRWTATVVCGDMFVQCAVNTDELSAAKLAAYNVLLGMQQDALNAIGNEVQP